MLKNEKLISTTLSVGCIILVFDELFTLFNNHMWPILNIPTMEIYALPFLFILFLACYKLPSIRNEKYIWFPLYTAIAINLYGIIHSIIN